MNNDLNYKLYKSIFNNIILKNKIYNYIIEYNKTIIENYHNSKDKLFKVKFQLIVKYDKIDLNFIIKSENYKLLKDILKAGYIKFNDIFDEIDSNSNNNNNNNNNINNYNNNKYQQNNLELFLLNFKNHYNNNKKEIKYNELLLKFYNINCLPLIQKGEYRIKERLMKSFLISSCKFLIIKLYNDYYLNENFNQIEEFKKYSNLIYKSVLLEGDIQVLEFLFKTINLELPIENNDEFNKKVIIYSTFSNNRNQILNYLLNEMNFKIAKDYTKEFKNGCNYYNDNESVKFYENLLKLDFQLFKRVAIESNQSLLSTFYKDEPIYKNITNYAVSNSLYNGKINPFNNLINFIQNSIYSRIVMNDVTRSLITSIVSSNTENLHLNYLLNKIQLLINYNDNNNNEKKEIKKKIKEIENYQQKSFKYLIIPNPYKVKRYSKNYNITTIYDKPSLYEKFNSYLNNYQYNNNSNNNLNDEFLNSILKPSKVLFEENENSTTMFINLERETKRIYIFDFLLPILIDSNKNINNCNDYYYRSRITLSIETVFLFIIYFSKQFNNNNNLEFLINFINSLYDLKLIFQENEKSYIINNCQKYATQYCDPEMVNFIFNNILNNEETICFGQNEIGIFNKDSIKLLCFDCNEHSIEKQINYLSILLKYNINYPFSIQIVLKRILTNKFNKSRLTENHLIEISKLIENYYNNNQHITLKIKQNNNNNKNEDQEYEDEVVVKRNEQLTNIIRNKFHSFILIKNEFVGDYYFKNNNNLFHNWNSYLNKSKY